MIKTLVLISAVVISVYAIRCYDYTSSNTYRTTAKSWVDCSSDTQYCYKSYIESYDANNQKTDVEGRACGTSQLCMQKGCVGNNTDKACCCTGDLCNSVSSKTWIASFLTLVGFYFVRM